MDALIRFVDGGGVLVAVGDLPTREPAGLNDELARALYRLFSGVRASRAHRAKDPAQAASRVASAGGAAATLSPSSARIRGLRLERAGQQAFLVHNERAEAGEFTATFPAPGVPEVWDPDTGSTAPAGVWRPAPFPGGPAGGKGTAVPLRLEAKAAIAVVFRTPSHGAPPHVVESNAPVERLTVEGHTGTATVRVASAMTVHVVARHGERRYEGTLTADDPLTPVPLDSDRSFRFDPDGAPNTRRPLGSWTDLDPAHSGSAVYEDEFTLDTRTLSGRRWSLELGEVCDVAEITVNGHELPARLWTPYRCDATSALSCQHDENSPPSPGP